MSRLFDNASNQYLSVGGAVLTAAPITMACWFYADENTTFHALISLGDSGSDNQHFNLQLRGDVANDPLQAQTSAGSAASATTSTGYSLDTWHHACGVFAAANDRRVYLDGGGKGTNTTSRTPTGIDETRIGARTRLSIDGYMSGRIAEVGIWNVALSDEEVLVLARGVSPLRIRPGNLVAYWPLYGVGSPEPDYRGGYHLTLNNAPTQADHAPVMPIFFVADWQGAFTAAGGGTTHNLTATIAGVTSTPSASLAVARSLSVTSAWVSSTPNATLTVARLLAATSAWQSTTGDATLINALLFTATIGIQTATNSASLAVARSLTATSVWQSLTNDATLTTDLLLSATIGIQTATDNATLNIARALIAASDWQTSTPGAALTVARALAASSDWQTTTPGALLAITRPLAVTLTWQTATGNATLINLVTLSAISGWQTTTPAATVTVSRALQATSAWQATTGTGGLTLAILMAVVIGIQTATGSADLETEAAIIRGNRLFYIGFRDKRAIVEFRDKRAAVIFRNKRG